MPGITPNLDELAAAASQADTASAAGDAERNIPTLSNSMRIDVDKEVEAAKAADQAIDSSISHSADQQQPTRETAQATDQSTKSANDGGGRPGCE